MLARESVDRLFSDVVVPGRVDGFDLRDLVLARWSNMRVLLTSGRAGSLAGDRGLPAVCLLRKPYHRSELAAAIGALLDSCPERGGTIIGKRPGSGRQPTVVKGEREFSIDPLRPRIRQPNCLVNRT